MFSAPFTAVNLIRPFNLGPSYDAIIQPRPPIYFRQCVSLIFRKRGSDHEVHVRYHFLSPTLCVCVHSRAVHPGACGDQMLMCLVSFFYHFPHFLFKLHFYVFFFLVYVGGYMSVCALQCSHGDQRTICLFTFLIWALPLTAGLAVC